MEGVKLLDSHFKFHSFKRLNLSQFEPSVAGAFAQPLSLHMPSLEEVSEPITAPINAGPPDIIEGLLPRQGELVIAGETNIGKSLIALEICSSLITGQPLWGELVPTMQARKIIYCLGEHYGDVIKRLALHTKLPFTDQVIIISPDKLGYDKWLVSKGAPNMQAVKKFTHWCEGADLIVFDPFSAFVTGIDVENDNVQMRLVLDTMSLIAQNVGASCLILAHQGKPIIDNHGKERARKSYAIRGASAIEDAATNIFYLGKAEGESEAAQRVTGNSVFALSKRKYKGEAPDVYRLFRDESNLTHSILGNRPFSEVLKLATQAKMAKLHMAFPQMSDNDIIKALAAIDGISEVTIKRHLGIYK